MDESGKLVLARGGMGGWHVEEGRGVGRGEVHVKDGARVCVRDVGCCSWPSCELAVYKDRFFFNSSQSQVVLFFFFDK